MPRNNQRRTTTGTSTPKKAKPKVATPTSVLDFVSPTEIVDLPSEGRFYPENHPLHGEATIEIRYMTAKDEDILTSRALLKKGVALDKMINNLLVDKRLNPDDMLVGDKNAILFTSSALQDANNALTGSVTAAVLHPLEMKSLIFFKKKLNILI